MTKNPNYGVKQCQSAPNSAKKSAKWQITQRAKRLIWHPSHPPRTKKRLPDLSQTTFSIFSIYFIY